MISSLAIGPGEAARWPHGHRAAVALAFDLDGPTGALMVNGEIWNNPDFFYLGSYGPYKVLGRLLDLLRDRGLKATFFVPSWVAAEWPKECRRIVDEGHEVGHHGHKHEMYLNLSTDEQHEVLNLSQGIFRRVFGQEAVGYRTPSGDWAADTIDILVEHGFRYSSSMRGDDIPYFHDLGADSTKKFVEIPAHWEFDDYAHFAYHANPNYPAGQDRISSYRLTLKDWNREFDHFWAEGACLSTIFHPKVIGKPGRLDMLDEFIGHMQDKGEVWFAQSIEIADWWMREKS